MNRADMDAALIQAANEDLRLAMDEGSILVCQTQLGLVELSHNRDDCSFEVRTQGIDSRVVHAGDLLSTRDYMAASIYWLDVQD